MEIITRREEQILLAIGNLGDNAYLVAIIKHLSKVMNKTWSVGAIHIPLRRLEKAGYITAHYGETSAVRGGKRKKIYSLTPKAFQALKENKRISDQLWTWFSEAEID